MEDDRPTTASLLEAWREATRAAELADRLAALAVEVADQADSNALASEEIATMAEQASEAAERAAQKARYVATKARELAGSSRQGRLTSASEAATGTRADEVAAQERYHQRENEARKLHED